jgi:hypothetical protein
MDVTKVTKILDVLVFGLTNAGVAKEAVVKVVEVIRRNLALPAEPAAVVKLKTEFSDNVKESLDGPSLDRGSADTRPREARPASGGAKSN